MSGVIICWGIAILLIGLSIKGKSFAPKVTIGFGIYFFVVGLAILMEWKEVLACSVGWLLGIVCFYCGVSNFILPFRFRKRVKGAVYQRAERAGTVYRNRKNYIGYQLIFMCEDENQKRKIISHDKYTEKEVERQFRKDECYDIWINPKKTDSCRVSRWQNFFSSIPAILAGIAFLCTPFVLIFDTYFILIKVFK